MNDRYYEAIKPLIGLLAYSRSLKKVSLPSDLSLNTE